MKAKIGQDMATGLLFIAIGAAALYIGSGYSMGTPQKPGTGVLPFILSCCLIGTGMIIMLKSLIAGDIKVDSISWRALGMITIATVAFGYFIDRLGLIPTMIISMTLGALGTPETRWREYLIFLTVMLATGWALFIWLLGMPIPSFAFSF